MSIRHTAVLARYFRAAFPVSSDCDLHSAVCYSVQQRAVHKRYSSLKTFATQSSGAKKGKTWRPALLTVCLLIPAEREAESSEALRV